MNNIPQTSEAEFLQSYDASHYQNPNASVDIAIFTLINGHLHVLTIQRAEHPFQNAWSLVGGYVDMNTDSDLETAAKRKLFEKTGVETPYLEQICTIGNAMRDPRGWSITTVYFALIPCHEITLCAGKNALNIQWSKISGNSIEHPLAFDHSEILKLCLERLRSKVLYTSLPVHLMPKDFTLGDLQKIYEIILDKKLDHKSFRRRILSADIVIETKKMRHDGKRPALLYTPKNNKTTHYFMRTIEGAN